MIRRREFIAGLGAAAWPLMARAQQGALPEIGYLDLLDSLTKTVFLDAFRRGIGEQGYIEGRNVQILYRYGEYQNDRWPELAADLVRRRVAVIFSNFSPALLAAKKATGTIPIVFALGSDPVQAGLVASLRRPGGNVTGTGYLAVEVASKRLELLHEIAPAAKSIGYLYRPNVAAFEEPTIKALETAARTLGLRLETANANTASEIERAFAILVSEGIEALVISAAFIYQSDQVVELAAHYALPAIDIHRKMVERQPSPCSFLVIQRGAILSRGSGVRRRGRWWRGRSGKSACVGWRRSWPGPRAIRGTGHGSTSLLRAFRNLGGQMAKTCELNSVGRMAKSIECGHSLVNWLIFGLT
jgi:putative ABC transport system substrate-binding protein